MESNGVCLFMAALPHGNGPPTRKQKWVTDVKVSRTVINKTLAPQSYLVNMPNRAIRMKKHHLIPVDISKCVRETINIHISIETYTPV